MQDTQPPIPLPPTYQKRRTRWWIPVVIVLGVIAVFIIGIGIFFSVVFSSLSEKEETVSLKSNSILMLDLKSGVSEFAQKKPFSSEKSGTSLFDVLQAIKAAKSDNNIKGIYIKGASAGVGMAKLTEIRDALVDFKTSKKFTYAYLEEGTKADYYLASVADSIIMPQEGMLIMNAFGTSAPFMKGLFEKLGVSWHVEQFEEYKSAAESMSRDKWSEPAKEELRALIQQRKTMFENAVASSRNMSVAAINAALSKGLYTADSLKAAGFIDGFARETELKERISRRLNPSDTSDHPKLATVSINRYLRSLDDESVTPEKTIAIVYASGAIYSGTKDGPFADDGIYSKSLIADLRKAKNDDDVSAILLRIDSPGGSAFASDEVWAEIQSIRKIKPIYASMSDVAASGGYYLAMACDTIICHPATVTGSIGVIMAIPNLSGTMGKLGVTVDTLSFGQSANFMSGLMPLREHEKAALHSIGEGIYKRFVQKVADSRKKSYEDTRLLARGRVWTGEDANKAGLTDINGGLMDAIKVLKKRIGVKESEKVNIEIFPKKLDDIAAILAMFGISNDKDDEDEETSTNAPNAVHNLMASISREQSAVNQIWKTLPTGMQVQVKHAATVAELAKAERGILVLPEVVSTDW